jgi:hypothetical protein
MILPRSKFTTWQLRAIFANQKRMSPAQREMAKTHPHLFWVEPKKPARRHTHKAGTHERA